MSYLNPARLHFAGRFYANPSTVNNIPINYELRIPAEKIDGGWNPCGDAVWKLSGVKVTKACYADGSSTIDPKEDPIVGTPIEAIENPFYGKIVDLDPQNQGVSELWGFQLRIGKLGSGISVVGDFATAPFSGLWGRCKGQGGMNAYGAFYQSVLENLVWGIGESRFLKELEALPGKRLSIKFNVDDFIPDIRIKKNEYDHNRIFPTGRIVGTIGPADDDEPMHYVAGRLLNPTQQPSHFAQALVTKNKQKLLIDLGNSLPTKLVNEPTPDNSDQPPPPPAKQPLDIGTISLFVNGQKIGDIDSQYTTNTWYEETAGVVEFALDEQQHELVASNPLIMKASKLEELHYQNWLGENPNGQYLRADMFVFRLDPEEEAKVEFRTLKFGEPAANAKIDLTLQQGSPGDRYNPPTGVPRAALSFHPQVKTDDEGKATLEIKAFDPGNPRHYIDGQVYTIQYTVNGIASNNELSLLVFNGDDGGDYPTWEEHVGPVFKQYARLYPVMETLQLGDYESVKKNAEKILRVLLLPRENSNHMPVTRDFSAARLRMFKRWIEKGCPEKPKSESESIELSFDKYTHS